MQRQWSRSKTWLAAVSITTSIESPSRALVFASTCATKTWQRELPAAVACFEDDFGVGGRVAADVDATWDRLRTELAEFHDVDDEHAVAIIRLTGIARAIPLKSATRKS